MNAPVDDITIYMGRLDPIEYEQRRRIRTCRNAANYKARRTENATARELCWLCTEKANEWIYAPTDTETLTQAALFLRRLLTLADQIETLEVIE